jgi:hypothetical protein
LSELLTRRSVPDERVQITLCRRSEQEWSRLFDLVDTILSGQDCALAALQIGLGPLLPTARPDQFGTLQILGHHGVIKRSATPSVSLIDHINCVVVVWNLVEQELHSAVVALGSSEVERRARVVIGNGQASTRLLNGRQGPNVALTRRK